MNFLNVMKWLKRSGLVLVGLVLLLAVIPFFVFLNDYIPQIEKAASARLKEPVKIESLKLALLPAPRCRESIGRERLAGQTSTLAIAFAT